MKTPIALIVVAALLSSVPVFAEGKPQEDWAEHAGESCEEGAKPKPGPGDGFLKAAEEYQQLGLAAIKAGEANNANIYLELAQIKRDAAAAAVAGKDFNWARYHELKERLTK